MRLMVMMKGVLLKETASKMSKQTGLSRGATGVQSARLTTDAPRAPGVHTTAPCALQDRGCLACSVHLEGRAATRPFVVVEFQHSKNNALHD